MGQFAETPSYCRCMDGQAVSRSLATGRAVALRACARERSSSSDALASFETGGAMSMLLGANFNDKRRVESIVLGGLLTPREDVAAGIANHPT